jgi:solute carrier family 15 (peptide/histidine transporter), member 3/4
MLYTSLLNTVATGGYHHCVVAFGMDQFDESQAAKRAQLGLLQLVLLLQ